MARKLPDISKLDRESLMALQNEIQSQLAARAENEKAEAIKALDELAKSRGFSLDELVGQKGKRTKKAAASGTPKYRNPAKPSETWTGKGRAPNWFKEAIDGGKDRKDLEI